jgi:adenine-specific DNA-methyltransferase
VKVSHEYVLAFCKNRNAIQLGHVIDPNTREESNLWKGYAENSITKNGSGNPPSEVLLPKGFPVKVDSFSLTASDVSDYFYKEISETGYITRQMTEKYNITYPIRKNRMEASDYKLTTDTMVYSGWANVNKLKEFIHNGFKPIMEENNDEIIFYLSENGVIYYKRKREKARNIVSVLRNMGTTEQMRSELESMGIFFSYPKPKELIKYIIKIGSDSNDIILDFFAGSGTTAHSVIELNKEEGLNYKFIIIQIPEIINEKTEAFRAGYRKISEITIERNKRVIQKIEKEELEKQPDLLTQDKPPFKTGFKVYKLAKSNFPRIDFVPDPAKTEEENLSLLNKYIEDKEAMFLAMIDEKNIFDEVLLKNGFMLNYSKTQEAAFSKNNIFRIKDSFKECLICMDITIDKQTLTDLEAYKDSIFICLERSLDTTIKWNLKHLLGDQLIAF